MERRWHARDGGRRSPHRVRGYLKHALTERGPTPDGASIQAAVREGAPLRVRPKAMTVAVILAGLPPVLLGTGTGSEMMSRIAVPMIGGILTAPRPHCCRCS